MAILAPELKKDWNQSLEDCQASWIGFGLDTSLSLADRLNGMAGLIDWRLHGQVADRIKANSPAPGSLCLFPLNKGTQNFLLLNYGPAEEAKAFSAALEKLGVTAITLADSTFPKDFLTKLKQTLGKAGIACHRLEPEV